MRARRRRRKPEGLGLSLWYVPYPGSHSARGLAQAPVSSRNRIISSVRAGFLKSC